MKIDSDQWRQTVVSGALQLDVTVSADQAKAMGAHARELILWNRTTNLTAITEPLEVAVKHYVDSLAAHSWVKKSARVLDAGSGGGFPGIPLNILRPDLAITLVDSVRKKVSFLKHAIRTLGLKNIDAVHGRLETLGRQPEYRSRFDTVICRAFSSLEDFSARTAAFVAPGGCMVALKGPQADHPAEEGTGISDGSVIDLGGACFRISVHRYRLPILDSQRRVVRLTPMTEARGQRPEPEV